MEFADDAHVAALRAIARELGFELVSHRLELFGRRRRPTAERHPAATAERHPAATAERHSPTNAERHRASDTVQAAAPAPRGTPR